ncbi:hypothetical protein JTE90_006847 [Oedothorax gibbosus]|uniref:DDE Tnp4 domain-containing protein n=1 Tax=Oedothorax gibbosus TaxID=931172 RepID=A0AAV6TJ09_9ARAC|nr:hypothetical protein JTE90_006847 [Oedothorax gibbosus]
MVQPFNVVEQQLTFSHYKNSNTLKALIGIAPSGGVTFISDLYCGSISDKEFFKRSGLLQLLEKGDIVLADKGFRIEEELIEAEIGLMQPLFLKEKIQFTIEERSKNKLVSCLRVHVERAISRIKTWKKVRTLLLIMEVDNTICTLQKMKNKSPLIMAVDTICVKFFFDGGLLRTER